MSDTRLAARDAVTERQTQPLLSQRLQGSGQHPQDRAMSVLMATAHGGLLNPNLGGQGRKSS